MQHKLIIALDNLDIAQAKEIILEILQNSGEHKDKILFKCNDLLAEVGFQGLQDFFKNTELRLMLDPKWHDIPNTLKNYIRQLANSGLAEKTEYVTIHASNGFDGCKTVVDAKKELGLGTKILAVTALTSLGEEGTQAIFDETAKHAVLKLAGEALRAGVDGIVCSPLEVEVLREVYGENFILVNPGVRFSDGNHHDQKRVLTPAETIQNGSTDIVMGRPILEAEDMSSAVKRFFEETQNVQYTGNQGKNQFEKILYTGTWKEILSYIGAFYIRPEGGKYCRLASGLLSNAYVNIGTIERNYLVMEKAAREGAQKMTEKGIKADLVMGAQMGSVRFSLVLAEKLGIQESIYTEKLGSNNEEMALKRHDISLAGRKVVISEDIVTKGSTLAKMKKMIEESGGEVVAIVCVGNRFGEEVFEEVPLLSCYTPEAFEMYWDDTTLEKMRINGKEAGKSEEHIEQEIRTMQEKTPQLPEGSLISEKPKNEWEELVESMR